MNFLKTSILLLTVSIFASCDQVTEANFEHPLQAFENEIGQWHWMDIDGMLCRDSSATGIGVRLGEKSTKWMIYLMGGGACFTPETCASNPSSYDENQFLDETANSYYNVGLLNNERAENPVKDWNVVFVPYCTGDVHSGNLPDGVPLGGTEKQQYVGNPNVQLVLDFLQPYMEEKQMDELMVTGISAGGFGTHITFFEAKERFPNVKTHLINDSGPLISDTELMPFCLNFGLVLLYNLAVPEGYLLCCSPSYGLADIYTLAARKYPDDNFGLMSYTEDNTIRYFFSAGQNTCTGGDISGELFKQGLNHLSENVLQPTGKWSTFYKTGTSHTFIQSNSRFYDTEIDGIQLYDWVNKVMNGEVLHLEE